MDLQLRELAGETGFRLAWPVMRQLRTQHTEESFVRVAGEMADTGYRLFGAFRGAELVGLAGVGVCLNLYQGRHLWVYELVVDENQRSRGCGAFLLREMEGLARTLNCEGVELCSGVQRQRAHRFYEEAMGYRRVSHVFSKRFAGDR